MDTTSIITLTASVLALGASVAALVLAIRGKRRAMIAEIKAARAYRIIEMNDARIAKLEEEVERLASKKLAAKRISPWDEHLSPIMDKASEEELDPLVGYILKEGYISETLSINPIYKRHKPNHREYIEVIEDEIRAFGGHTGRNLFRGGGPAYREIVIDVAKNIGAKKFDKKKSPIEDIEKAILEKVMGQVWRTMSQADRIAHIEAFGFDIGKDDFKKWSGFDAYINAAILAQTLARNILGASAKRGLGVGPPGWVITGAWALFDFLGPAFRVTRPCVVHIAYLRLKYSEITCQKCSFKYKPSETSEGFCPKCGENN